MFRDWKEFNILKVCVYYKIAESLKDEWVLCPCHEVDGRSHRPSAKVYRKGYKISGAKEEMEKDSLICYGGCKSSSGRRMAFDSISLIAKFENWNQQKEFKRIYNKLLEIDAMYEDDDETVYKNENIRREEKPVSHKTSTTTSTTEEVDKFQQALDLSRDIHQLHERNEHYLDDFFSSRAILFKKCEDMLKRNCLEFRHQYKTVRDTNGNIKKGEIENYIVFFDKLNKFAIRRRIDDICFGKSVAHEDRYRNIGGVAPTIIRGSKDNIIVFEGLYDLLSLYSHTKDAHKYTWISLNSVSNDSRLVEKYKKGLSKAKNIYLLTDNDEAGTHCIEYFQENFEQAKDIRYLLGEYNDVCDAIKHRHYIKMEEVK